MEKVMPSFDYEPIVLFPKLETSYEEEDKRDTNGARPFGTGLQKEPRDFKGRKDSPKREDVE
jgi:hypothetical protein